MTETFWCEHAWLDDGVADSVLVSVSEGRITAIETGTRQAASSQVLRGLVITRMPSIAHYGRARRGIAAASGHGES